MTGGAGKRPGKAPDAPEKPAPDGPAARGAAGAEPGAAAPGGAPDPEPTRYGDWEKAGRCIDF